MRNGDDQIREAHQHLVAALGLLVDAIVKSEPAQREHLSRVAKDLMEAYERFCEATGSPPPSSSLKNWN